MTSRPFGAPGKGSHPHHPHLHKVAEHNSEWPTRRTHVSRAPCYRGLLKPMPN